MKLFKLENETPVLSEEARLIKDFNNIIRRDGSKDGDKNGRKKEIAIKELGFIYFYCSFDSRFELYETDEERIDAISTHLSLPENWKPDSLVRKAIETYTDLCTTESMNLVNKQREAIKKLESFIDYYDPSATNKSGGLIFGPDKMQSLIKGMPEMIKALNESKKIVEAELQDKFGGSGSKIKERSLINNSNFDFNIGDSKI